MLRVAQKATFTILCSFNLGKQAADTGITCY
jgi:hypothetical protein